MRPRTGKRRYASFATTHKRTRNESTTDTQPQSHRPTESEDVNHLTQRIIGAAIEVHRALGPGLLESLYEAALSIELDERRIRYTRQVRVHADYKGRSLGDDTVDLIVEDLVVGR